MSRSRRISRPLIGVLVMTIAIGSIVYYLNAGRSDTLPEDVAAGSETVAPAVADAPAPTDNGPRLPGDALVTSTPSALAPAPVTAITATPVATASATPAPAAPPAAASAVPAAPATPAIPADRVIAEGKARLEAGDLVAGREILNNALIAGNLSPADEKVAKDLITQANQTLLFSSRPFADDPWQEVYTVRPGDVLARIANRYFVPHELISQINDNVAPTRIRAGQKLKVLKGPMHAVVDKSEFTLDVYLGAPGGPGSMYVRTFRVGLGANDSTPTGLWGLPRGAKLKNPVYYSPRGEGVIAADDPNNPLGEYWIALEGMEGNAVGKTSYGIHGTIEPETIGTQASLGCIRLHNDDIKQVFEMLYEVKSTVRVVD